MREMEVEESEQQRGRRSEGGKSGKWKGEGRERRGE